MDPEPAAKSLPPPLPCPAGVDPAASPWPPPSGRALRLVELCLILWVAFGPSLYTSLAFFLPSLFDPRSGGAGRDYSRLLPLSVSDSFANDLRHVAGLAVCGYILFRQRRSFRSLGVTWKQTDLYLAVALLGAIYLASHAMYIALRDGGWASAMPKGLGHYLYGAGARATVAGRTAYSFYYVGHTAVTGLFEELIVRAYLMREVVFFTGSVPCAVLVSVAVQTTYHLYQGWPAALCAAANFLVLSLFYAGTWRATPIVVAHMLWDLAIALRYTWG